MSSQKKKNGMQLLDKGGRQLDKLQLGGIRRGITTQKDVFPTWKRPPSRLEVCRSSRNFFFSVSVSRQQLKRQTQAGNQLSADHQFKCPGVGRPDDPLAVIIWLGESNYTFQCHFKSGWLCLHSFLAVSITSQLIFFDSDSMWAREEFRFPFTVCSTGKTKKFPRFVRRLIRIYSILMTRLSH